MKELEIAAQEELMHSYSSSTVIISTYGESARIEKCEPFFFSQEAMINMFRKGAEWQAKQNPWRNFKDEYPKPNSHILRKMTYTDCQAYGKTIYYADFWGEDRPAKWEQDNDKVVYEWQYINK
ncbi:hypothetical protein [Bacteroides ovatus]|jgi:hypothetical protein|uniref:hypothetical protein n=1 Tax=Bacteroides ovatus TaxID=28116 RepID=UPI0022E69B24|nr:hypothetical protein [Bacteroides ovatus]